MDYVQSIYKPNEQPIPKGKFEVIDVKKFCEITEAHKLHNPLSIDEEVKPCFYSTFLVFHIL